MGVFGKGGAGMNANKALSEMMKALRNARDNSPKEWDALMRTKAGTPICKAWDLAKSLEKGGEL